MGQEGKTVFIDFGYGLVRLIRLEDDFRWVVEGVAPKLTDMATIPGGKRGRAVDVRPLLQPRP